MPSINNRIFPDDPNSKKRPIQKGDQRNVNNNPESLKDVVLRSGSTKTVKINVNGKLTNIAPTQQNYIIESKELNEADPNIPDPYCVIPPKSQDDNPLVVKGDLVNNKTNVTSSKEQHVNTDVVNNTTASDGVEDTYSGYVNELLSMINDMAEELESEGYSVSLILNSSLVMNVLNIAKEGMAKEQVKQIIKEELDKMPYNEVCNLSDVLNAALQAADIQNVEAETGMAYISLINLVINNASKKADADEKPVTLSDLKQIIDNVFFENSQKYRESIYNDDNAEWKPNTDLKDYISHVLKSLGYNPDEEIMNDVYVAIVTAVSKGELNLIPNIDMVDNVIMILLNNKDVQGVSINTVSDLIDMILGENSQNAKSSVTYGDIKEFINKVLNDLVNDCVLPPVEPPVIPPVIQDIVSSKSTISTKELKVSEKHI